MRTAADIFTTIDKVRVGDLVHLRSGATFTVTALSLKVKGYQYSKHDAPHDTWEVEGIDHDSVITGNKTDGAWKLTQHFADHVFKTTITTDIGIVCIRKEQFQNL